MTLQGEILAVIRSKPSKTIDLVELFNKVELTTDPDSIVTELELMETVGQVERVGERRLRLCQVFNQKEQVAQQREDEAYKREQAAVREYQQVNELKRVANSIIGLSKVVNKKLAEDLTFASQVLLDNAKSLEG